MTAMILSDIHTEISTIEQLASYAGFLMHKQFPGSIQLTNNEGITFNYPRAQRDVFEDNDGIMHMRFEFVVPLKADAAITARLPWMQAEEIDKASPVLFPEGFKNANLTA